MILFTSILAALALLIITLIIRTVRFRPVEHPIPPASHLTYDHESAVQHLAEAVRFKTVSNNDGDLSGWEAFTAFHSWLEKTYPLSHSHLDRELISSYTLHYTWEGTDKFLEPILLTAHQDVVPAGDPAAWDHDPFSGDIEDGYLWGRGTLDVKIQIIAIFEAIETLLAAGIEPERTIHLCFGHDEEIGGRQGAAKAAEHFREQQLHFAMVLDEGGAVTENILSGIAGPIAVIGIGEKGYMDLELSCISQGGHSSMPLRHTALSRIAQAITALHNHPFPTRLTTAPAAMFRVLGPHMSLINRIVLANLWLFKPIFLTIMEKNSASNAMIRTTMAPTMASGSDAPNVLPSQASSMINLRLLHGDNTNSVIQYVQNTIDDPKVLLTVKSAGEPSKISPIDTEEFSLLTRSIAQIFPDAIITPYLMVGGTDARKYEQVAECIYRFSPYQLDTSELNRVHNIDERISLENIRKSVEFYLQLIQNINEDNKERSYGNG